MTSTVIQVESLSKYYRLGLIGGGTLREDVSRWIAKLRGMPDPLLKVDEKDHGNRQDGQIWALRDVNLEVIEGEILGIIGRNGAGKSTLLKILSQITAPTEGRIKIKGRVGSLLEVGTGFHPELTGRENIYLNGTILGMSHAEVTNKLEEIVDFAEMAKFIDTPVKRYSSGMTVRLAFAVAAHLEPEILIIDEVLAVGDAEFQKKCLGKMRDVAGHGRTVLFVSHNMGSINDLCTKVALIENGHITSQGGAKEMVKEYLSSGHSGQMKNHWTSETKPGNSTCKLLEVGVYQAEKEVLFTTLITKPIELRISILVEIPAEELGVSLFVRDAEGRLIIHSSSMMNRKLRALPRGRHDLLATLPAYLLNSGEYFVSIAADIPNRRIIFNEENLISFEVVVDCSSMGRYSSSAWNGFTGAGIAKWDHL